MTKRKITETKAVKKIYHLGGTSAITNSAPTIKEFKTLENPNVTSTTDSGSLIQEYIDREIREKLGEPHPFEYNDIDELLKRFAMANSIVEKICDFTIGDGVYINSKDEGLMNFADKWISKTRCNVYLRPWLKEGLSKGSGWLEVAGLSTAEKNNTLKLINPASMYVKKDKFGATESYNQFVGKNLNAVRPEDIIPLNVDEVLQLNINVIGFCPYGFGIIHPALQAIDNFLLAQKSIHILTKRKANVPMHVIMGNEEKDDYPSQGDIDGFASKISFMDERVEYVTGPNVEIKAIDFGNIGDKFKELLENDYKLLSYSFQVPEILLGADRGFVGSSEVQMDAFLRNCRARQTEIIFVLKQKLFDKLFENNGFSGIEYDVCFNVLTEEERRKTILSYKELFNSGATTQMKIQAEKKLAYMLGFEYDEVEAKKEMDKMNQQMQKPGNSNGGQTGKTKDKEIDKTSNGDNGPFKAVSSKINNSEQIIKEKYFVESIHTHENNDNLKVSEWTNLNVSEYKDSIVKSIVKDEFLRLRADNDEELRQGYLTQEEITKLKEILAKAVIENRTVGDIKRDVLLKMNIRDLTEGVKLSAERRIEMIVHSELTRVLNKGFVEATNDYTLLYKWDAILDERTCPVCGELNNKIFDSDTLTQETLPPIHINCRCSLAIERLVWSKAPKSKYNGETDLIKSLKNKIKEKLAPQEIELMETKIKDTIDNG